MGQVACYGSAPGWFWGVSSSHVAQRVTGLHTGCEEIGTHTHTHTLMHTHSHVCTHIHTHTCVHHAHIPTHTHVHVLACTHTHTCSYTCIRTHTLTHTHSHECARTHICNMHTLMHTHSDTDTRNHPKWRINGFEYSYKKATTKKVTIIQVNYVS